MFTRFPDREVKEANEEIGAAALFADTGLHDDLGEMESIESEFAFGFLPAGPGLTPLSVLMITGPGALIGVGTIFFHTLTGKREQPKPGPSLPTEI